MAMYQGRVAWFNNAKGFGFLSRDSGPDVFCHYTAIQSEGYKSLKEGTEVEFNIIKGIKGDQAADVVPLNSTSSHPINASHGSQTRGTESMHAG